MCAEIQRLRNQLRQKSEQISRLQDGVERLQQGTPERAVSEQTSKEQFGELLMRLEATAGEYAAHQGAWEADRLVAARKAVMGAVGSTLAEIASLRHDLERALANHGADLGPVDRTITSLCDRILHINNICHDPVMQHDEKVRQIEEWSAGFLQVSDSGEKHDG
jgi:chromosome segregation ATPase